MLANGALPSQSSGEGEIRKNIIQADLVEGIVALPTQLFYSVTIPVTLWFISKNKKQKGKTLFIDARKMGYMVDRKHRDFTDEDIDVYKRQKRGSASSYQASGRFFISFRAYRRGFCGRGRTVLWKK